MEIATLRVRYCRKTGAELSREVLDHAEMSEEEYAAKLVWAMTGKTPEAVARDFLQQYQREEERSA